MCLLRTEILPELVHVASIPPCALLRICPGLSTTLSTAHTWAQAATTSPEPEISTLHRAGLGWAGLGWAGWAGLLSPRISLRGLEVCGLVRARGALGRAPCNW